MGALLDLARKAAVSVEATPAPSHPGTQAHDAEEGDPVADARKSEALAFLVSHPNVRRACFVETEADPDNIILTVAIREPWGAVEVLVSRERFDAFALMELSLRYPDTYVEH